MRAFITTKLLARSVICSANLLRPAAAHNGLYIFAASRDRWENPFAPGRLGPAIEHRNFGNILSAWCAVWLNTFERDDLYSL